MALLRQNKLDQKFNETKKTLFINKILNMPRRYKNYKHLCYQEEIIKIYKVNIDIIEGRNRHFYNNSWRPQYPIFNNE